MISKDTRKRLIALCDRFINSGDDVTLAHLLDALNTAIPDPILNTNNIEPADIDIAGQEQQLFNHPDPYDLEETDRVDEALTGPIIVRSFSSFDIAQYIKFDDPKLIALITKVDTDGPGASLTQGVQHQQAKPVGKPREWSIESFLGLS